MKTPMLLTLLSITQLFLITILPFASANLVVDMRKKTPYADFCVSALTSDRRSSTVDTPTLGLIMVDKVNVNAKSTLTEIQDLLRKSPNPRTKQALVSCEEGYKFTIIDLVPSSKDSLTGGVYKFAEVNMNKRRVMRPTVRQALEASRHYRTQTIMRTRPPQWLPPLPVYCCEH